MNTRLSTGNVGKAAQCARGSVTPAEFGEVAQGIERPSSKGEVAGSSPASATISMGTEPRRAVNRMEGTQDCLPSAEMPNSPQTLTEAERRAWIAEDIRTGGTGNTYYDIPNDAAEGL